MAEENRQTDFSAGLLTALFTVAALCLVCCGIKAFYPSGGGQFNPDSLFVVPIDYFRPEPLERIQFLACVFLLPFFVAGCFWLALKLISSGAVKENAANRLAYAFACALAALFLAGLQAEPAFSRFNPLFGFWGLLAVAVCFAVFLKGKNIWLRLDGVPAYKGSWPLAGVLLAVVFLSSIFGLKTIDGGSQYAMHFEAVFSTVAAVLNGQGLLVDIPAQYGLYAAFLAPVFKATGISVLWFTIVMSGLTVISYLLLLRVMNMALKHKSISLLGFCMLVFCQFWLPRLLLGEIFYQSNPLRLVFPALGLFLACKYFYKASAAAYYSAWLASAAALLWNFDSGIAVFGAWLISLLYLRLAGAETAAGFAKSAFKDLCAGAGALALVAGIFFFATKLVYGAFPDLGKMFVYVNYFYGYGFNMLPMRLIHPWNIAAALYIGAIIYAAAKAFRRQHSREAVFLLMCALLGIGLFPYYQGRSTNYNFLIVAWPAVLIFCVFADWFIDLANRMNSVRAALFNSLLFVFMASPIAAFMAHPLLTARAAEERLAPLVSVGGTVVTESIAFIRSQTRAGERPLIISYNAAVYNIYTKTKPPLNLPSLPELYLRSDFDKLLAYIRGKNARAVFLDASFLNHNRRYNLELFRVLGENYYAAVSSGSGAMLLYRPFR